MLFKKHINLGTRGMIMKIPYGKDEINRVSKELMSGEKPVKEKLEKCNDIAVEMKSFLENEDRLNVAVAARNKISVIELCKSVDYTTLVNQYCSVYFSDKSGEVERILECTNVQAWALVLAITGFIDK